MSFAAVNFYGVGRVQFYRISGILVASEIDLPGLIPGAPGRAPQVTIRLGEVPDSLPQPTASGPTWQIAGKQFLLGIPNIARFLLNDGSEIVVAPEPEATVDDLRIFTLGGAFRHPAASARADRAAWQRGARRRQGRAVLRPVGSGKIDDGRGAGAARGFPLVSEDVCVVTATDSGTPPVHPDGRQLKLWAQSINKLDLGGRRGERVRASLEKFYVDAHDASTSRARSTTSGWWSLGSHPGRRHGRVQQLGFLERQRNGRQAFLADDEDLVDLVGEILEDQPALRHGCVSAAFSRTQPGQ